MPIKLILIEDHPALRQGLQLLLEHRGYKVVGSAGDTEAARALVDSLAPDVVIVDVNLGHESGIELTRQLVDSHPFCRIVLYTGLRDPEYAITGLEAGAMGYALKDGDPEELVQAIEAASDDRLYVDPRMGIEFEDLSHDDSTHVKAKVLTRREREILNLLAQGHTGEQVATELVLSIETVKTHVRNAMVRLDATTRVHAIALALRDGEITAPGVAPVRFRRAHVATTS